MREPSRDLSRLEHILSAIEYVESYTNGISEELLKENKLYLHATTYNVQIIGEAVYKLSIEFKQQHPLTPWAVIEKMRHILVHDYFKINLDVLWEVIKKDIPVLKAQVEQYINEIR
jgi:uncharacterized protein with HEPN domain